MMLEDETTHSRHLQGPATEALLDEYGAVGFVGVSCFVTKRLGPSGQRFSRPFAELADVVKKRSKNDRLVSVHTPDPPHLRRRSVYHRARRLNILSNVADNLAQLRVAHGWISDLQAPIP
ncbi:MAG: hypothetical protein QXQ53_07325 [Candidatus Methanosuratincola sp.]